MDRSILLEYYSTIVGVRMIHKIMFNLNMVVGNGAECVSCSAPLFCHLVHVGCSSVAFQSLVLFTGTPGEKKLVGPLDLS